jgi:hypothetical protein
VHGLQLHLQWQLVAVNRPSAGDGILLLRATVELNVAVSWLIVFQKHVLGGGAAAVAGDEKSVHAWQYQLGATAHTPHDGSVTRQ